MTEKLDKFLIIVFLALLTTCQGAPLQPHEKYAHEISDSFVRDMEKKYGLICTGSGGRMPKKVEAFTFFFNVYHRANIEEARELMITLMTKLVERINAHQKIQPFLKECPFTWSGADIVLSFHNKDGSHYHDGSVAFMCRAREGKIAYKRAELQMRKALDFHDSDGSVRIGKITEDEVFVLLLEEPYEEALRIVKSGVNADQNVVKTP